jgi:hypothetical protein
VAHMLLINFKTLIEISCIRVNMPPIEHHLVIEHWSSANQPWSIVKGFWVSILKSSYQQMVSLKKQCSVNLGNPQTMFFLCAIMGVKKWQC